MAREIKFDAQGNIIFALPWKAALKVLIILGLAVGSRFLPFEDMTPQARTCLMLFVAAAGLWITEAIPPFATGIMVIVLSIYLLGSPGSPPPAGSAIQSYQVFLNPISSPILVLFFGGFMIAVAAAKHGLDIRLAKAILKPFGTHPRMVLLGIIVTTAFFSMFMSNTATTAMMIAILAPLFAKFEGRDPFKKALVLAVPFAANIGGMGTVIGTPPNAVAVSVLNQLGYPISFVEWMFIGVPLVIVLLLVLWFLLVKVFKPREDHLEILFPENLKVTWDLVIVSVTFIITLALWLAQTVTGIPSAVVALIPVMVFTAFGIINRDDLKQIEWHVLILIAGGITLGVAMKESGLSDVMVRYITYPEASGFVVIVVMAMFALVLSNFMSHTAAANLIIPIIVAMPSASPMMGAVSVALACSLAMSLPISTPPNAIAFATEVIETKDLAKYGTLVSVVGMVITLGFLWILGSVLGLA